jgi:ABC-type uncharacterized transport system substrate-binding protein
METFRRLLLGLSLIAGASALLLFSDLGSRVRTAGPEPTEGVPRRLALLQHASQAILDEGRKGMLAGLAERGWVEGKNLDVRLFNAEGDVTVGQAIAREMANGGNDLLMTISTPSLQAVANANRSTRIPHVFGLVTDPVAAGVGISGPTDHPAWLAGYGTMQPVAQSFALAKKINPALRAVGVIYNAGEANAVAQVKLARTETEKLGLELVETSVDNSAGVGEAAAALTARGVEAIWVPGDVTVMTAIDSVVAAARRARVPVFSVIPPNVRRGALFDLGADYHEVGRLTGLLAGDILHGTDPATIRIENVMPEILTVNLQTAAELGPAWKIPPDLLAQARMVIGEDGKETSAAAPAAAPPEPRADPGRTYRVALAYFVPEPSRDACEKGLLDGLAALGFTEGKNLLVTRAHAQGEVANIAPIIQNFDNSANEVIVTFSTPVLQGALAAARSKPVVFTYVIDPVAAGAGKSLTDHRPNVTGIGTLPPVAEAIAAMQKILPNLRSVGTVYNNGEANSVRIIGLLRDACRAAGLQLVELTAPTTGDVLQATQALVARKVDAIYVAGDNTVAQALDGVIRVATTAKIPVINEDPGYIDRGILLSVGAGFYHSGKAAAPLVARVLNGESPGSIPFQNVSVNTTRFNPAVAAKLGLQVPDAVIRAVTGPGGSPNPSGKTWKIAVILYSETPPSEETLAGMVDGWKKSPLVAGKDYTVKIRSAQGDMSALGGLLDAAVTDGADIIVPLSTPTLQAAIAKIRQTPMVFSLVADPVRAGAGKSFTDHLPNVTGVAVLGPVPEMLDLLQKSYPQFKRLGTLFCPAEINSVVLKDLFEAECRQRGFTLEAVAANSPGELPDAALALMARPIDAVVQISDNLSSGGFAAITKAARQAQKPLISLNSTMVPQGAAIALGRDYHEAGVATVGLLEQVIAGGNPGQMPFILPPKVLRTISLPNARAVGLTVPPGLRQEADAVIE